MDARPGRSLLSTEDPSAALFALRPAEFVAARDRLAADLRRQGRKDEAAAIKALTRPSPSVFAVNQLARRDPAGLERLRAATAALERTQGADAGEEGRRAYRQALAEQKEILDILLEEAHRSLEEAGLGSGRPVLDRVSSNLRFAMLDEGAREQVRAGRLTRDVEAPDLSSLLERFPPPAAGDRPRRELVEAKETPAAKKTVDAPPDTRASAGEARAARVRERLEGVRARHREAEAELARVRQEAEAAQAAEEQAEQAAQELRRRLTERQTEAAAAARASAAAQRALAQSTSAVERLGKELADLERQAKG
jgi:hypothetical protein